MSDTNRFVVVIRKDKYTVDLDELFPIDKENVTSAMMTQASKYAWLTTLAIFSEGEMITCKRESEAVYAEADIAIRDVYKESGEKFTEAKIRSEVLLDEDYVDAIEAEDAARFQYNMLKSMVRAMEQRATMLVSLGAYLRHEGSMTGMTIRERESDLDETVAEAKESLRTRRRRKTS